MYSNKDTSPKCKQCGECCRKGGPALHAEDLPLIEDGTIPLSHIVTLRPGERVFDQPAKNVVTLDTEILKLKGVGSTWSCIFLSPESNTCAIYSDRPAECEALFCRDIEPLQAMYAKDRIGRADILPDGHPLLELINEHDKRCNPADMEKLAMAAREGDRESGEALKEMVVYDNEVRRLTAEKGGMPQEMNDFLFGRPLKVLLGAMKIKVYDSGETVRFAFSA